MNYTVIFHPNGRELALRPEVEVVGTDANGKVTVRIIWSVSDDRTSRFEIINVSCVETAIKILEAYLRSECFWDDRHSTLGVAAMWQHLEEVESAEIAAEEIAIHRALTGDGFVF